MDAALQSLPIETLQTRLSEAMNALHELQIGNRVVSVVTTTGQRAQYSEAQANDLRAYIATLQDAIRVKQGGAGRRPIYLSF